MDLKKTKNNNNNKKNTHTLGYRLNIFQNIAYFVFNRRRKNSLQAWNDMKASELQHFNFGVNDNLRQFHCDLNFAWAYRPPLSLIRQI